jgi:hypothetical protein
MLKINVMRVLVGFSPKFLVCVCVRWNLEGARGPGRGPLKPDARRDGDRGG